MRTIVSDGTDQKQSGKCVAVYKMSKDKDLDLRSIQDVSNSCVICGHLFNKILYKH